MRVHPVADVLRRGGAALAAALCTAAATPPPAVTLASTTSTDNSGLYDHLLPKFTAATGIAVRVIAVGTGRALSIGRRGDADVLVVHDPEAEREFVAAGHGVARVPFMYNDFVVVGPRADPAGVRAAGDVLDGLRMIAQGRSPFVSRGDDSGTHKKELRLWRAAGLAPATPAAAWYREAGAGMGAVLNLANELPAYTLTDRATWISFENRDALVLLIENQPPLYNPYSVIRVNPRRHPSVNHAGAERFAKWLRSPRAHALIADYRVRGVQLFHPLASDAPSSAPR